MKSNTNTINGKKKWKKIATALVVCALVAGLVVLLWPEPLRVETALVESGPLIVSIVEEGKTRIRHRYTVSAPVAGFLNRTLLRPGDAVGEGKTVLAVMEAESSGLLSPRLRAEAEARLRTAEAGRALRRSELDRTKVSLDLARKQFERLDRLLPSGGISRQEWDIAESRMQVALRETKTAEFALRMAEFEVQQARSALIEGDEPGRSSEVVRIVSPVNGYVLNIFEESARTVPAGAPIMEVGDPTDLEGEVDLFSVDAAVVAHGADVLVEGWGGSVPLRGRVALVERSGFTKVSALGVEEQRVKARIDFIDSIPPDYRLGDRYRIRVRILLRQSDDVLLVPLGTLFRRGGDWTTFTIEDGKAVARKVEIGQNDGFRAEVIEGLSDGDRVILHPSEKIAEGVAVKWEH